MGVTLDSIRQLNIADSVSLQGAGDAKTLQGATTGQKIGAFFHTDASKARNADVVNTLKGLVASEQRYSGIREHAQGLIDGIKLDKPIQGSQLRGIVEYLDSLTTNEQIGKSTMADTVKWVSAIHGSLANPSKEGGAFGVPHCLQDRPESVKVLYNKQLGAAFQSKVDNDINLLAGVGREFRYALIANEGIKLDDKMLTTVNALKATTLPDTLQNRVLEQTLTAGLSKEDALKTIERFETIQDDASLTELDKSFVYTAALGDENGIISDADFDKNIATRHSLSAMRMFTADLEQGHKAEDALQRMGLGKESQNLSHTINNAVTEKAMKEIMAGRPVTKESCQAIYDKTLQRYDDALREIDTIAVSSGDKKLAISQLEKLTTVPKPDFFTELANTAGGIDKQVFTNISNATSYQELDAAMKGAVDHVFTVMSATPQEVSPELDSFKSDLVRFGMNHAIASMPEEERGAFIAKMNSPEAQNLQLFYEDSAENGRATQLSIAGESMHSACTTLSSTGPVSETALDKNALPPTVRTQFSAREIFAGDVSLLRTQRDISASNLTKISHKAYDSLMQVSFQNEMRKLYSEGLTTFEKDITRQMDVTLPDGSKVPHDFDAAKDALAGFMTQRTDARYGDISPQERVKVNVIMAHISQEMEKASEIASQQALQSVGVEQFSVVNPVQGNVREFHISQNDNGDLVMRYTAKQSGNILVKSDGTYDMMREDSHSLYDASVIVPHAELDRLSQLDWDALVASPEIPDGELNLVDARPQLDETFCCNAEYRTSAQYNMFRADA